MARRPGVAGPPTPPIRPSRTRRGQLPFDSDLAARSGGFFFVARYAGDGLTPSPLFRGRARPERLAVKGSERSDLGRALLRARCFELWGRGRARPGAAGAAHAQRPCPPASPPQAGLGYHWIG